VIILNILGICLFCFASVSNVYCNENSTVKEDLTVSEKKTFSVITLKNGMKVILKKTDFDSGQVFIRITAIGGFASIALEKLVSGVISTQAALESGFEGITADKFYADEIELSIELLPYHRRIDGFSTASDFNKLLNYINQYFKKQTFTETAFNAVKKTFANQSMISKYDQEQAYQQAFLDINTQNFAWMQPLEVKDIQKADSKLSQDIFRGFFCDPAEFIAVVVGDFDDKTIIQEIEKYLGSIPKKESTFNFSKPPIPAFPQKNITKEIIHTGQKNSLARLTFPLFCINSDLYPAITLIMDLLDRRLSEKLKQLFNEDQRIESFYENPTFPHLDLPLLVIQFRSETYLVHKIQSAILCEVKKLCEEGITQSALDHLKKEFLRKDAFWLYDNIFWLTLLSDYQTMQWQMDDTTGTLEQISQVTLDQVNKILKELLSKTNHTFLYSHP